MTPEYAPTPTSEALLRERRWLLGFSQALVGPAEAEDLAQEAWLVALEKPTAAGYSPRAWLAGIARRLAASGRRRSMARGDRESLHHDDTQVAAPDAASLAEKAELENLAVAELLSLPQPIRDALLLRYRGGLSSAEIARRDGLPEATVRGRVKTGLDTLRTRMDARAGSRQAWAIGLIGTPAWKAAPAPLTTSLLLSAAMKKGLLAIVGSVLAATGLWWVSEAGSEAQSTQETDAAQLRSQAPANPELAVPSKPVSPLSTRVEKAAPDLAPLRFELIDEQARPLQASGGLLVGEDDSFPLELDAQGQLFTNRVASLSKLGTGTARLLAGRAGSWPCWFEVSLQPGTHQVTWPVGVDLPGQCLEAGAPLSEPIQLTLARDTRWAGELNNEQASLAEELLPRTLMTRADGSFELHGLTPEWRGWLELGPGWKFAGGDSESTVFVATPDQALSLPVVRTPQVIGTLIDSETGAPLAGTKVHIRALTGQALDQPEVFTDAAGRFAWQLQSGVRSVQVQVGVAPEWKVQSETLNALPVAGALDLGTFQLERAELLELLVLDPSGIPVAGARLGQPIGGASRVTYSDEQGRARLGALDSGPFTLEVFAPGFEKRSYEIDPRLTGPHTIDLRLGLAIEVLVEDSAGLPLPGRVLAFTFDLPGTESRRWDEFEHELQAGQLIGVGVVTPESSEVLAVFESDEDGRIAFEGLSREAQGTCLLRNSRGFATSDPMQILSDREGRWSGTVVDSSPPGNSLSGRVRSQSGIRLQGAEIQFEPFGANVSTPFLAISDAEGAFELSIPGELGIGQLIVRARGFARTILILNPEIEADRYVELELAPGRTVTFEFKRPDGSSCPELSVQIQETTPGAQTRMLHKVVVPNSNPLALGGFGSGDLKLLVTEGKLRRWFEPLIFDDRVFVEVPEPAWLEVRLDRLTAPEGESFSYVLLQGESRQLIHQGSFDPEQEAEGTATLPCLEGRVELMLFAGSEKILHRDDLELRWGQTLTLP